MDDELRRCVLCQTKPVTPCYYPRGSRREATVYVCEHCGCIQSGYGRPTTDWSQRLSCDADWGNVRHGKAVRLQALTAALRQATELASVRSVLDVGSNRGAFVRWCHLTLPGVTIVAIEPDSGVIDTYAALPNVTVHRSRLENTSLSNEAYDLVNLSHTLEHLDDPLGALRQLYRALTPEGVLVCEVPNIDAIGDGSLVEELFIDKHAVHFDDESLRQLLQHAGFVPLEAIGHPDSNNLLVIARKGTPSAVVAHDRQRAVRVINKIAVYADRLSFNRRLLPQLVQTKLQPLSSRVKLFYWGAGRIFDALVKYGGLQPAGVHGLVDRFLAGIVDETHGVQIMRPETLRLQEPHAVVVLARTAESEVAREAYSFGVRHVIKFSEILSQVTDAGDGSWS